jgi:hypothetical protein
MVSLKNRDMKLSTNKYYFIHNFISIINNMLELKIIWQNHCCLSPRRWGLHSPAFLLPVAVFLSRPNATRTPTALVRAGEAFILRHFFCQLQYSCPVQTHPDQQARTTRLGLAVSVGVNKFTRKLNIVPGTVEHNVVGF